jgi:cell division protein FtsB
MGKRLVPTILIALLVILHLQLWLGRGSVPSVTSMASDLEEQRAQNAKSQLENDRMAAEIRDLKEGLEMVEERARVELSMVRPNEILVQVTRK